MYNTTEEKQADRQILIINGGSDSHVSTETTIKTTCFGSSNTETRAHVDVDQCDANKMTEMRAITAARENPVGKHIHPDKHAVCSYTPGGGRGEGGRRGTQQMTDNTFQST